MQEMTWRDGPVPETLRGIWRRLALERADGSGDTETLVVWLQGAALFADIRVPAARLPEVTGFEALDEVQALAIARQEGFAGRLQWREGACAWRRAIDFRPLGVLDEGAVRRERRMLVETGLHADYVEHWWQEAQGTPVVEERFDAARKNLFVRIGDTAILARDRRAAPPGADLPEQVSRAAQNRDAAVLRALLDCEISLLRRTGEVWTVQRSTLPWREGSVVDLRTA